MSIIFDSIKTRNLDTVYEINLNQYYRHLYSENIENAAIDDADFAVRITSGLERPELNAILQTDITDNLDEIYNETQEFFSERELPYTWYIPPSQQDTNLKDQLTKHGLRYIGDDVVLGLEIENMVRNISAPNSLYIEAINSYDKLEKWVDIYSTTRNIREETVEKMKSIYKDVNFTDDSLPWRKYIGWLNGEPVTASTLVTAGGIAVVYDESIHPKYKGWGIEDAINITPLKKAEELGYKVALISTNVGSTNRFAALEFKELFKVQKMVHMGQRRRGRRRRR